MKKRNSSYNSRRSSALLIVLLSVVLLTVVIGALLTVTSLESSTTRQDYQGQAARQLAVTGLNSAITQIRLALGPWDNPYANFCTPTGSPPTFFWSMSPGLITQWSYTSTTPSAKYPLFSQSTYGDTALVNLNAPNSDGNNPIIGGASAPAVPVYWANVLQNPTQAPSSANQLVGRYAFWVDDENAKINLNTADGTMKYTTKSLGLGSPSEVSLSVLQQGGTNITAGATNIVQIARTTGFNSPQEILRAAGTTPDLYTNNVFNLTCSSRSPDLNIFGQPKMAMLPVLGDISEQEPRNWFPGTNMVINAITLQPLKEIYPTPSQLPAYTVTEPFQHQTAQNPWPLTFRQLFGPYTAGDLFGAVGAGDSADIYLIANYAYGNGQMLTGYLSGTNSMGQAITWPAYPNTSTAGFAGKYSPRQIDSIVAQIVSLGAKDISPDIFYHTDPTGYAPGFMLERGRRTITAPFLFTGWLSDQLVTGLGRTPKVDSLLMKYTANGSIGHQGDIDYQAPWAQIDIWLEWWLPAAFQGGRSVIPTTASNPIALGNIYTQGLNNADQSSYENDNTQLWLSMWDRANPSSPTNAARQTYPLPQYNWACASIPKADDATPSYWSDQLLTDDQGMDIQGSPNNLNDPDQPKALQYHDPYAWTNFVGTNNYTGLPVPYLYPGSYPPYQGTNGTYAGTGGQWNSYFDTPLFMGPLQVQNPTQDWSPGEIRDMRSQVGYSTRLYMKTTAAGSTLNMGGGVQVTSSFEGGYTSDLDPVPLDVFRGNSFGPNNPDPVTLTPTTNQDQYGGMPFHYDGEAWLANANVPSEPGWNVRDFTTNAVIPAAASVPVPGNGDGSSGGNTEWVLSRVADPLVNKFPGDWTNSTGSSAPTTTMEYSDGEPNLNATVTYTSYDEYSSGFHAKLTDPDSYWMPQADCGISYPSDLASQTIIPRSARMPNVGYLQYLRTGIIPDDEVKTLYPAQHGTPFRLLSYAPSDDAAQTVAGMIESAGHPVVHGGTYPDWAMLDLLYIPSLLAPYGGPYGYYDTSSPPVWQGYGTPSTLANYSTKGGSTPGRVNPNGSVIYTTNTTIPVPGVSRLLPMEAILQGLMVNQSLSTQVASGPSSFDTTSPSFNPNPGWSGGSSVDAPTIAQAIYTYLTNNGPMRLPAELCNVPEIAALRPGVNATRNDLIRQVVGNLTTQSNVFSVWTVGQTIKKNPSNLGASADCGKFESGDTVLAESRFHFVVERYLDPGADGVYGNSSNPGPDGISGTYDDPVDPVNHPYCPRYLYRVIAAEEIR